MAAPRPGDRNEVTQPLTDDAHRVGSAYRGTFCLFVQPKILGRAGFLVAQEVAGAQINRALA